MGHSEAGNVGRNMYQISRTMSYQNGSNLQEHTNQDILCIIVPMYVLSYMFL